AGPTMATGAAGAPAELCVCSPSDDDGRLAESDASYRVTLSRYRELDRWVVLFAGAVAFPSGFDHWRYCARTGQERPFHQRRERDGNRRYDNGWLVFGTIHLHYDYLWCSDLFG